MNGNFTYFGIFYFLSAQNIIQNNVEKYDLGKLLNPFYFKNGKFIHRNIVIEAIESVLKDIASIKEIRIIGSQVRGYYEEDSDVDFQIVVKFNRAVTKKEIILLANLIREKLNPVFNEKVDLRICATAKKNYLYYDLLEDKLIFLGSENFDLSRFLKLSKKRAEKLKLKKIRKKFDETLKF